MSEPTRAGAGAKRDRLELPPNPRCARCSSALADRFGWCGNCRVALCFECGRAHFCTLGCAAAGCIAGRCVRLAEGGRLVAAWGLPGDR
ncbi:MAG TPA: hypothetical protein VFU81_10225 [Thermomicrobiales bacterium]|nr:hypothetical protein [Thermomicrobiales bacterium]